MQRLANLLLRSYEPVQPWEFRLFAAVGIGLAVALWGMAGWVDGFSAAQQVMGDTFASAAAPLRLDPF